MYIIIDGVEQRFKELTTAECTMHNIDSILIWQQGKIILDKFLHRICRADIIYNTIKKIWKHVGTLGDLFRACTIIEKTDYQHISNTLGDYK